MQRSAFLEGEGDAWFHRNLSTVSTSLADGKDPVMRIIESIRDPAPQAVLEVGCGSGHRAAAIAALTGAEVSGLDPSGQAVEHARSLGVVAQVGTADALPFATAQFDVVLFGFCLYLCDREDLFRIAAEADRVLKSSGWVIIHDFFSPRLVRRPYHHRPGLWSFKMDYRTLFDWHPLYTCLSHQVLHHVDHTLTDDIQDWTAVSLLRKCPVHDPS